MKKDDEAAAARSRIGHELVQSTHLYGLLAAVRALIATHPDQDKVRQAFDQLIGQMLASPGFLVNTDFGVVLRDFSETVFQPPVEL
jgi:hypothetical protein